MSLAATAFLAISPKLGAQSISTTSYSASDLCASPLRSRLCSVGEPGRVAEQLGWPTRCRPRRGPGATAMMSTTPRAVPEPCRDPLRGRDERLGALQRRAVLDVVVPVLDGLRREQLVRPLVLGEERDGQAGLRVEVEEQHLLAACCEPRAEVGGEGGLTHAALVVDDRDNLHRSPPGGHAGGDDAIARNRAARQVRPHGVIKVDAKWAAGVTSGAVDHSSGGPTSLHRDARYRSRVEFGRRR